MVETVPVATSVPAEAILGELQALGITHAINVPDTHQRTLLAALARQQQIRLLTACTEDEALAINAGLYVGGAKPIISIQNTGLLAAMNNVKGIAMDARVPTCMLVGYFGRDVHKSPRDNPSRAIHLIEPTLEAWGIRYYPLEHPDQLHVIQEAYQHSLQTLGPSVVLVGAPTS
jgi:sulfopyruvate decarboxylase TPP-binding subunit